jgi:hypothetical protein
VRPAARTANSHKAQLVVTVPDAAGFSGQYQHVPGSNCGSPSSASSDSSWAGSRTWGADTDAGPAR